MYKEINWLLSDSGEKELRDAGANKELIETKLKNIISTADPGIKKHVEVLVGLYEKNLCYHKLVIEEEPTGLYITYCGFIGYVFKEKDIFFIADIQDLFKDMKVKHVNETIRGNKEYMPDYMDKISQIYKKRKSGSSC